MVDQVHMANINSMLDQIRQYEVRAKGADLLPATEPASTKVGFSGLVKGAFDAVNEQQQKAKSMSVAYEQGEDIPLTDVVLQMQKASVAFEATLQIRNKVIKAYEDIRNMPV